MYGSRIQRQESLRHAQAALYRLSISIRRRLQEFDRSEREKSMTGGPSTLIELLHGRGAHVSPLACVEDLSAGLAGRTVSGFPHSIWQILGHMNYWMEYEFNRINGQRAPYPTSAGDSWPVEAKPADETEWRGEVWRFRERLEAMARLAESDAEVLTRPVEITTPEHAQQSNSVEAVLWQTLAHNSYHVGQIVLLRRLLNAWPPPGGGDTW
jgi:uncharacterized damage-inducible protein DinB